MLYLTLETHPAPDRPAYSAVLCDRCLSRPSYTDLTVIDRVSTGCCDLCGHDPAAAPAAAPLEFRPAPTPAPTPTPTPTPSTGGITMLHNYVESNTRSSHTGSPYEAILCTTCAAFLSNYFVLVRGAPAINTRCTSCRMPDSMYADLHTCPDGTQHAIDLGYVITIVEDVHDPDPHGTGCCVLFDGDLVDFARGVIVRMGTQHPIDLQPVIDILIRHEVSIGYDLRSCYRLAQLDQFLECGIDPDGHPVPVPDVHEVHPAPDQDYPDLGDYVWCDLLGDLVSSDQCTCGTDPEVDRRNAERIDDIDLFYGTFAHPDRDLDWSQLPYTPAAPSTHPDGKNNTNTAR